MQKILNLQNFLAKKQNKDIQGEKNQKVLEKHKEVYDLFIKAESAEEIQKLERWLLK